NLAPREMSPGNSRYFLFHKPRLFYTKAWQPQLPLSPALRKIVVRRNTCNLRGTIGPNPNTKKARSPRAGSVIPTGGRLCGLAIRPIWGLTKGLTTGSAAARISEGYRLTTHLGRSRESEV